MTLVLLALAALLTSALSGVLGMAGGFLLMGACGALLPVSAAMVVHGSTQAFANGSRVAMLLSHVHLRALPAHLGGSLLAVAILLGLDWRPDAALMWIGLGLTPFAALLVPRGKLDWSDRPAAFACGLVTTALQVTCGVAGPLLDVFFIDSRLDRRAIIATKAATQVFSHVLKIAWHARSLGSTDIEPALLVTTLSCAALGTFLGVRVLERVSDTSFRVWSRRIVLVLGACFLVRGAMALSHRGGPRPQEAISCDALATGWCRYGASVLCLSSARRTSASSSVVSHRLMARRTL